MPATNQLNWFPPAPSSGPASILALPMDDYIAQPKKDGFRVVFWRGQPFTRQGTLLSPAKGADAIKRILRGIEITLDGEWMQREGVYIPFDLPDLKLPLDDRLRELAEICEQLGIQPMRYATSDFAGYYEECKRAGDEGVVMKKRNSLYSKCSRPGQECRDWLKRRFQWDK